MDGQMKGSLNLARMRPLVCAAEARGCVAMPSRASEATGSSGGAHGFRLHVPLGLGTNMGAVEREPGEGKSSDEIADDGGDLVPDEVVQNRKLRMPQQPRRKQEHVHDGMLEHHVEE